MEYLAMFQNISTNCEYIIPYMGFLWDTGIHKKSKNALNNYHLTFTCRKKNSSNISAKQLGILSHLRHEKKTLTFHYTGSLTGIPIMVYP